MTANGIHVERPHKTRQCEACFEEFTVNAALYSPGRFVLTCGSPVGVLPVTDDTLTVDSNDPVVTVNLKQFVPLKVVAPILRLASLPLR